MAQKRKAYLLLEARRDEIAAILPPHLRGLLSRPSAEAVQQRKTADWFAAQTASARREQRRKRATTARKQDGK